MILILLYGSELWILTESLNPEEAGIIPGRAAKANPVIAETPISNNAVTFNFKSIPSWPAELKITCRVDVGSIVSKTIIIILRRTSLT